MFTHMLRDIHSDLERVAELLDHPSNDPGIFTQDVQTELLTRMKELLETFRDERLRRKNQKQQQGGGGGKPRLVPEAVELVMLRKMQEDVNRKLEGVTRVIAGKKELTEVQKAILERLSHQQGGIRTVFRNFLKSVGIEVEED